MTTQQKNWLDMYLAVKEVYEEHQTIFDAMTARQIVCTAFLGKIVSIQSANAAQSSNITGVAQDKDVLRINLCNVSYTNMALVKAYAISINNNTLKTEMDYELSDLLRTTDESIGDFCQHRLTLTNANIGALAAYDITAATITTWQDAIDDYNAAIGNPRNAETEISNQTDLLKTLFTETNALLNDQLDLLVQPLKFTNNDVFKKYFKARIIIDRGAPAATPANPDNVTFQGTVTDSVTTNPVAGVSIQVGSHTTTSQADGSYLISFFIGSISTLPVSVTKTGYGARHATLQIEPNKTYAENFSLVRNVLATYQQSVTAGSVVNLGALAAAATGVRVTLLNGIVIAVGVSNDGTSITGSTVINTVVGAASEYPMSAFMATGVFVMAHNTHATDTAEVKVEVLG